MFTFFIIAFVVFPMFCIYDAFTRKERDKRDVFRAEHYSDLDDV